MAGFGGRAIKLPEPIYALPGIDPGAQSGWDAFSPPIDISATPSGPILTGITRKAATNQQILATGDGWDSTLYFKFYGQVTTPVTVSDNTQSRKLLLDPTNQMASWAVPAGMPAGAIMVHPVMGSNVGRPLMLNTARVWRSQDMSTGLRASAVINGTISVYGENLVNSTPRTWIYLEYISGGVATQAAFVSSTSVNEDRVKFTLPTTIGSRTLVAGDLVRIWIHSGRGGKYGWSKAPYDVTVETLAHLGVDWANYGGNTHAAALSGLGATSQQDTTNVVNARNACGSSPGIITLSAGTYYLNSINFIGSGNSFSIEGAGIDVTIIKMVTSSYADAGFAAWLTLAAQSRFKNLTIDTTGGVAPGANGAVLGSNLVNVKVINTNQTSGTVVNTNATSGVISSCILRGLAPLGGRAYDQISITDTTLTMTDASGVSGGVNNGPEGCISTTFRATDCNFENITCNADGGAQYHARIIAISNAVSCVYMDNAASSLVPVAGTGYNEQIFIGEAGPELNATGCSSTSAGGFTTVTYPSTTPAVGKIVQVVLGKGIGQWGLVTAVNAGTKTVTLDQLWAVNINGSSVVLSGEGTTYSSFRNCSPTHTGAGTATAIAKGFQLYQQTASVNFFNTTITGTNQAYSMASNDGGTGNANRCSVNMWCRIENTTVVNCITYDDINDHTLGAVIPAYPAQVGVLVRGTTATHSGGTAIGLDVTLGQPATNLLGHDNCSYQDATSGISITTSDYRDIWWNTAMIPGAATGTTKGISGTGGPTGANVLIFANTGGKGITGFASGNKAATVI